ncbi:MAG: hypothetical protein H6718_21345 [Polyangiaceae bacterium]|nr:hypothetical protein [Polyangiaceae bacterium]
MFKFNLRLTLGKECDEAAYLAFECKQPGTLEILEKETGKLLQTIALDEVRVAPDEAMGLSLGIVNGYGSIPGTLAIEDYNFDGEPDIAVVRNDWGLYRGPMYTVFLWDKRKKRYVLNKPLTELTETDIVSFNPDKKLVSAMWKDGCCNHVYRDFRMVNNRPVLIYKLVMKEGDQHEERLVHGVWKRRKVSGDEPDLHP